MSADDRPLTSGSIRIRGMADAVVLLGLMPSWLGLLGQWHWGLDLLSHFRWQYLVVGLVALMWGLWRRTWWLGAAAVVTLLLNGWLMASLVMGDSGSVATVQERLRVISLNVLTSNQEKEAVRSYLSSADADVVVLLEVDAGWEDALEAMKESHPYGVTHSRQDNFGIALASRLPLKSVRTLFEPVSMLPSIEARLIHQGRELMILATHPLPPIGGAMAGHRDAQMANMARYVAAVDVPVLVVGDLNATPWSAGMRLLCSGNLAFRSADAPWWPTWKVGTPFAISIDHAVCTPPLVIARRRVGPEVGSDHRPLEVEVGWSD